VIHNVSNGAGATFGRRQTSATAATTNRIAVAPTLKANQHAGDIKVKAYVLGISEEAIFTVTT
jgi:hypothetical protein